MITGPEDGAAAGHGRLRASDADREHVIDTVKTAFADGRLDQDELDDRVGQALAARTYGALAAHPAGNDLRLEYWPFGNKRSFIIPNGPWRARR